MISWQMIWEELIVPISYKVICSPFDSPSDDFPRCHRSSKLFWYEIWLFFLNLLISGLPVFTKVPPTHAAPVQSTTFQVTCQAEGFPRPTVTWSRVGMPLPAGRVEVNQGTLTIKNLIPADSGLYDCVAKNIMGTKKARTNVAVQRHLGLYIHKLVALFKHTYVSSKI